MQHFTGSIQVHVQPIAATSRKLAFGWAASTGSIRFPGVDRTGQIVVDGLLDRDGDNVYLVRESTGHEHVLVHSGGGELKLNEDMFWPWGPWKPLVG